METCKPCKDERKTYLSVSINYCYRGYSIWRRGAFKSSFYMRDEFYRQYPVEMLEMCDRLVIVPWGRRGIFKIKSEFNFDRMIYFFPLHFKLRRISTCFIYIYTFRCSNEQSIRRSASFRFSNFSSFSSILFGLLWGGGETIN